MTALLASLPVHWRFFVKKKLMEGLKREGSGAADVQARVAGFARRAAVYTA